MMCCYIVNKTGLNDENEFWDYIWCKILYGEKKLKFWKWVYCYAEVKVIYFSATTDFGPLFYICKQNSWSLETWIFLILGVFLLFRYEYDGFLKETNGNPALSVLSVNPMELKSSPPKK